MKNRCFVATILCFLSVTVVPAQDYNALQKLALVFAQVAAGGEYESVVNITNRGTTPYIGNLNLYRAAGQRWNPLVNGNAITNGVTPVSVGPGATTTFRITRSGTVQVGFATITKPPSNENELTSFLDGTLTYYIKSGGVLADSIGVPPSSRIYLTTIPFDDFNTIALALANASYTQATVKLTLFSETNARVDTLTLSLQPNQHLPQYLGQFFPAVKMTKGRLEIQSDPPVPGTALTDIGGQFSSLPLLPSAKLYNFTTSGFGFQVLSGDVSIWIDGPSLQGYLILLKADGNPTHQTLYLTGLVFNGTAVIYIVDMNDSKVDVSNFAEQVFFSQFSLSMQTIEGSFTHWAFNPSRVADEGRFILTAIN
ncbi:MAG: hypothetical protein HY315_03395 [Acidobacteria bacterium]|nr:hypothetical protein [Acidobacteriota bacterium]